MNNMRRMVSLGVMIALIGILGVMFYKVIAPFVLPLFLAGMSAVVCQPMFRYFVRRTGNRVSLAAGLTTSVIMAALLIPLTIGTLVASLQLYAFAARLSDDHQWRKASASKIHETLVKSIEFGNRFLPEGQRQDPDKVIKDARQRVRAWLSSIGDKSLGLAGTTFGVITGTAGVVLAFVIGLAMYALALFYFLADGVALLKGAEEMIPVHADYQRELFKQFAVVVRSVVIATFLAALAQGLATTAALWFFGFDHLFVLFVLCSLGAMIPLAGTWMVWMPCAIILFTQGHSIQAIVLVLYGVIFVGFLDNLIRTYVLNNSTRLHPLLAFISVLGGIQAMGLWGVFIGPIVASCLHALINIFNTELKNFSRDRAASEAPVASISERPQAT